MPRWTPEARQKHSEALRRWQPWTRSTGPRTTEGKARSSRNAWKGGARAKAAQWGILLKYLCRVNEDLLQTAQQTFGSSRRRRGPAVSRPFSQFRGLDAMWAGGLSAVATG